MRKVRSLRLFIWCRKKIISFQIRSMFYLKPKCITSNWHFCKCIFSLSGSWVLKRSEWSAFTQNLKKGRVLTLDSKKSIGVLTVKGRLTDLKEHINKHEGNLFYKYTSVVLFFAWKSIFWGREGVFFIRCLKFCHKYI